MTSAHNTASPTPTIVYPSQLPVSARREDIQAAIRDHQVVVIAGETGSGKTTQIPKMCLEMGLAEHGMIGHTQPRRIAARSVAERIAEELGEKIGQTVGYQVRFTSEVGADSKIKLMTDGILLAEIQHDRLLKKYSTIIVDEAHERSLNIDFLLGYLKNILPQRPDLKVIITSATIDPERFAAHFNQGLPAGADPQDTPEPAPIIEVSGRTYPVEIRYRPLTAESVTFADDQDYDDDSPAHHRPSRENSQEEDRDPIDGVLDAVDELSKESPGDILVFFAGEREIRDAQEALEALIAKRPKLAGTQILPLFGRLSMAEQHRVFSPSRAGQRRMVLATNVAETSLTVPGIKYVIDTGTARISRYSTRTKVQRLPIERISQASANQRSGRCGRVSDGICIRLYSQDDFQARPEFTDPEILRTNLASVILQMTASGVVHSPEEVMQFPFVQPPESRAVKDGVALLRELGALTSGSTSQSTTHAQPHRGSRKRGRGGASSSPLTSIGRSLAALPVDPRLGRMIVEGQRRGCAREVMVLAAALTVQDPRERPLEKRQVADEFHARFKEQTSDFLGYLLLWQYLQEQQKELSGSAFRRMCKREYLNYLRIREWQDLYTQLRQMGQSVDIKVGSSRQIDPASSSEAVHKSLLTGLLSNIGVRQEKTRDYQGARGTRFAIFPGSDLFKKRPDYVVAAELVETSRLWARTNAAIDPAWVEEVAGDLLKRSYAEPHWSRSRGAVMAKERVTLYGVPLVVDRPVGYWRVDPVVARELFIRHALVEGDWQTRHRFVARNRAKVAEIEELENRLRRKDLRADDQALFEFFDARIPAEVVSQRHFDSWWKKARQRNERLLDFDPDHLLDSDTQDWDDAAFPRQWRQPTDGGELSLDLEYTFAPGTAPGGTAHSRQAAQRSAHPADGVTVRVPVLFLNQLNPEPFTWQIPGLRTELVTALIKSLPKAQRKNVVPAPDVARQAVAILDDQADPSRDSVETALERALRQVRSVIIEPGSWDWSKVPEHLRMHFQVRDAQNKILGEGDDLALLQIQLRDDVRRALAQSLGTTGQALAKVAGGPNSPAAVAHKSRTGERPAGGATPDGRRAGPKPTGNTTSHTDPVLERSGLTDWPAPDLPRQVDTTVSGQRIIGWPALDAAADPAGATPTADVRVFTNAQDQQAAQRRGTMALLRGRLPSTHRYISDHLANREKIVFTQNPHGSVDVLIQDCTLAAVDKLVPQQPPWTRPEYDQVFDQVRADLIDTVFVVTSLVAQVLADANTVRKLIKKPGSMAAVNAFADLRDQLERLVSPDFVTRTGWVNLQHLPRYVKAMQVRVDKLVGTAAIQRDSTHMLEVQALEDELDAAVAAVPHGLPVPETLRQIEWDIQELRVSFFAQELGTSRTVSSKRIRKALREATQK
ncbi:ATP-dependent RNA helicase HrpA [Kocuria sp.]|uniref:ATP-dependent RNA helicase HrpA n=1 Tax=Kocuria sp. TaxID=1871328 RepID=UPI0026DFBB90|nr:ATP-dependent RNA helicase HrpA [Kocuria sp.]MDO5619707.1 ATP-dependent RNA helicase HrpA [Kocuria sp.]